MEQVFAADCCNLDLEVMLDSAGKLLGTVSGENLVKMCLAFDKKSLVTEPLESLTREAADALDLSLRSCGSYMALIRISEPMQCSLGLPVPSQWP